MKLLDSFVNPMDWFLGDEEVAKRLLKMTVIVSQHFNDPDHVSNAFYEILTPVRDRLPKVFYPLFLSGRISSKLLARELQVGLNHFAGRFIAGDDLSNVAKTIKKYRTQGYEYTVDILGDMVLSEKEADAYINSYSVLFQELPKLIGSKDLNASIKISAVYSQIDNFSPQYSADKICERLDPIFKIGSRIGWRIYFDAVERDFREIQLLAYKKMYRKYGEMACFVLQSYPRDAERILNELISECRFCGYPLWVRLVLGAYWDYERHVSKLRSWDPVIYTQKEMTDQSFRYLFGRGIAGGLVMVTGTHNVEHILEALFRRSPEIQLIYGMGEPYAEVLKRYGIKVRFYMPILFMSKTRSEGIGYLLRRVDDNTSQMSFLRKHYGEKMKEALFLLENGVQKLLNGGDRDEHEPYYI